MSTDQEDKASSGTLNILLVAIVCVAIAAAVAVTVIGGTSGSNPSSSTQPQRVEKRTDPVYKVVTEVSGNHEQPHPAQKGNGQPSQQLARMGKRVFTGLCQTCHVPGLMGAPRVSDTQQWQQLLQKRGLQTLYKHAIHGFNAMPPKGGNPNLTDKQVKAAVDYILRRAGVK